MSVQRSLQQLQGLGEELSTQVDASSLAALQSDRLSLTHRLATLEHALHRQQEALQVRGELDTRTAHTHAHTRTHTVTHSLCYCLFIALSCVCAE